MSRNKQLLEDAKAGILDRIGSAAERKAHPITTGVLDYFPDALLDVAHVSKIGNDQHNPGEPLHWAKHKSSDEADALLRHLIDRGELDTDGVRHSAKVAWRALALLQREIDAERNAQEWAEATARMSGSRISSAPEVRPVVYHDHFDPQAGDGHDHTDREPFG